MSTAWPSACRASAGRCAANVPEEVRRSQVRVLDPRPSQAGEQAQIDYGQLGRWADPVTGKLRTVWAFVMVLCCSRHMFVRPVLKLDQRAWTECHVAAFEFFQGVPGPACRGKCSAPHFPASAPGRVMWPVTAGVQRQGDQIPATGHITVRVMTAS